jgi:hypothetical protein
MVTAYEEWVPKTEEVTLPSGKTALLRRPDLVDIITGGGDVPDILTNMIMESINGEKDDAQELAITAENLPSVLKMLNVIAAACFVEPQVVNGTGEPPAGTILAKWIPFNDRAHVFGWALGAQFQPAATFPQEQAGDVGIVPAGRDLQGEAESGLRDTG